MRLNRARPQFSAWFCAILDTCQAATRPHHHFSGELAADAQSCGEVQNAQRRALIGISLMHSVHFFVVGSTGGSLRIRATSVCVANY